LLQIILGSLLLSLLHACIPNHWIPLLAMGKAERWIRSETLLITGIVGVAHASSTILIGILVGSLGYRLSAHPSVIPSIIAPSVLIGLGTIYLALDVGSVNQHHRHFEPENQRNKASKLAMVGSLCVAMFFSPCIDIEAYYLTAGFLGWHGILIVSLIYLVVTVLGMVLLVDLGLKGAQRIRSHFLEHHEKRVTGFVLVALGVVAFFFEL
jgi:nickel/cobalt transporter (NicO) family protein